MLPALGTFKLDGHFFSQPAAISPCLSDTLPISLASIADDKVDIFAVSSAEPTVDAHALIEIRGDMNRIVGGSDRPNLKTLLRPGTVSCSIPAPSTCL